MTESNPRTLQWWRSVNSGVGAPGKLGERSCHRPLGSKQDESSRLRALQHQPSPRPVRGWVDAIETRAVIGCGADVKQKGADARSELAAPRILGS